MPDPINWSLAAPYFLAALAAGYFIGSIPFGLIFSRIAGLGDVRKIGSGNIGATNVLRTGNKWVAALTLLADIAKGYFPTFFAYTQYGPDMAVFAGLGAFLGHCFPVWLGFKGGKGVATFLGIVAALIFKVGALFALIWLFVAGITRYSSLAAIIASLVALAGFIGLGSWQFAQLVGLITVILIFRHKENINRLLVGEESKIGGDK